MRLNELLPREQDLDRELRKAARSDAARTKRPKLGEILVTAGDVSEADLKAALKRKRDSGRRIGEELVASGLVTSARVSRALRTQRRLTFLAA